MRFPKPSTLWIISPFVLVALLVATVALLISIFGWNWARAPIQRVVQSQTGRALTINGDLNVNFGWPLSQVHAEGVTFANPEWAIQKQMASLIAVNADVDVKSLLQMKILLPTVNLSQPTINLEKSPDGRKTWLLDKAQSDENAHPIVGKITLDQGQLFYRENGVNTLLQVTLATSDTKTKVNNGDLAFSASGTFHGLALVANGKGGPVLALSDEDKPYSIDLKATVGRTNILAKGQITSVTKFSAVDLQLQLRGESLAQLFPLLGVGFPETLPYSTEGHLIRTSNTWRYEKFAGKVGRSDVAGHLQVILGGPRPLLRGDIASQALALEDLGPPIGARKGALSKGVIKNPPPGTKIRASPAARMAASETPTATATQAAQATTRVLPDLPFNPSGWNKFDADVTLKAARLLRNAALPLDQLVTRIQMQDAVLTLNPLDFSAAGGHLKAVIKLDGKQSEIKASAQVKVQTLQLNKLFPTVTLTQSSVGQLNGQIDIAGTGNTVAKMLSTANGNVRLVAGKGEISKLLMEEMGLHLIEILQLTLGGDQTIALNCVLADFDLQHGMMTSRRLVMDTAVTTVVGSGQIDLGQEQLNLTLIPKTRKTSLISLRSPITVKGTFSAPIASLDKGGIIARGAGAIALGLVNPLLAFIPLIDPGPGLASECGG